MYFSILRDVIGVGDEDIAQNYFVVLENLIFCPLT